MRDFPSGCFRSLPFSPLSPSQRAPPRALPLLCPDVPFQVWGCVEYMSEDSRKKIVGSLPYQCFFKFWCSFPAFQLLFSFQGPWIAFSCIQSRSYSCNQRGKKGECVDSISPRFRTSHLFFTLFNVTTRKFQITYAADIYGFHDISIGYWSRSLMDNKTIHILVITFIILLRSSNF